MVKKSYLVVMLLLVCISNLFSGNKNIVNINNNIQLIHIHDSIFVHTTWHNMEEWGRVASNGMIIIRNGQAIMIDTPMDNEKTEMLTNYLEDSLNVELVKLIAGHYHSDNIGGLEYLQNKGIESVANSMTITKCKEEDLPIPSTSFTDSLSLEFNGLVLECRFFGGGHSFDNIVVWISEKQILFGGCLIKSLGSQNIGYIGDAVIDQWDATVTKVINEYPNVEIVVPGHGNYGGKELLHHTVEIVKQHKSQTGS